MTGENVLARLGPRSGPGRDRRTEGRKDGPPDEASGGGPIHPAAAPDRGVAIGVAGWRDLPTIARLQRRAFRAGLAYRLPTLALLKMLPGGRFLVARRGGAVVGCAIGDREGGQPRVVNLAVDPAWRGIGVGAALLAALEAAMPGGDVILMVEVGNAAARALYARAGYEDDGTAANYYGPGRHGLWMRKRRPLADGESRRFRV